MQIEVKNMQGSVVGKVDVSDEIFGVPIRDHLLWEVVKAQRASTRAGTHSTKTVANVRGGGKKPYKQKGTGNARQGSTRAPQFVGGGTVFGPHPRSYSYAPNKKVRRAALAVALSVRAKENKVVVVDSLDVKGGKTKVVATALKALGAPSALVVDAATNAELARSLRNLPDARWIAPEGLNVYSILEYPALVISKAALGAVEARFAKAA